MQDEQAVEAGVPAADRVLHSDPHDFAGLYIRHRASFTLHARRYLRDARDADEVVQEAFLRLFLALPELETELQALAYCRRTITNLCIDRYRAQARRPHLVDIATVPLEELADEETADPVVRAEDAALVRTALSMLSPLHRAALVKREIEEKPLPVIAEELEVPEESVKHLLFRARRALRKLLLGTSLAPGGEGDGVDLGASLRAGSGGLAALLLLLALGLGSGPNLKAIPVVGVDLPDFIGVTTIAKTVGHAVTDVVDKVSNGRSGDATGAKPGSGGDPAARLGAEASASPTASPSAAPPPAPSSQVGPPRTAPRTAVSPPALAPAPAAPAPDAPAPTEPEVTASPSASPTAEATESPEPEPTTGPSPEDSASPSPSPSPVPSPSPSDAASPESTVEPTVPAQDDEPPAAGNLVDGTPADVPASAAAQLEQNGSHGAGWGGAAPEVR